MKTRYTIVLWALGCMHTTNAQTLNNSNSVPLIGESYVLYSGNYISPGNVGANQTWDLSSLSGGTEITNNYVTPASSGYGAEFPNANLTSVAVSAGTYTFYNAAADGFYLAGLRTSNGLYSLTYTNLDKQLPFPCSYNTSWSDSWTATVNFGGAPGTRTGTTTGLADGYGTLITPSGTFTNVLRVKIVQSMTDNLGAFGTVTYEQEVYNYYKPGIRLPLAGVSTTVSTAAGQAPQTTMTSNWLDASSVGIFENATSSIGVDVFPNPATDRVNIILSSQSSDLHLQLIDGSGRVVHTEQLRLQSMGINRHELSVQGLNPGIYLLRLTSENGEQGVQRLVID